MTFNARKLFHSPVPGVFTPRSTEWNINHRRNVSPSGTLDQTPVLESADSRPGWYGRLQLHGPWVHGLPRAAIPAGLTGRRLGAPGYATRPRLGWSPRSRAKRASKVPPRLRGNATEEREGWIGDLLNRNWIG